MERVVLSMWHSSTHAAVIKSIAIRLLEYPQSPPVTRPTDEEIRACVGKLCSLALSKFHFQINLATYIEPASDVDLGSITSSRYFQEQLLSVAAFFGITSLVRDLFDQGYNTYEQR